MYVMGLSYCLESRDSKNVDLCGQAVGFDEREQFETIPVRFSDTRRVDDPTVGLSRTCFLT